MTGEPGAGAARRSALDLQDELATRTGRRVRLFLTDNRSSMVSVRSRAGGVLEIRMQRMFLDAPPEVLDDVENLVLGRNSDRAALRAFVDSNLETVRNGSVPPRPPPVERLVSAHHDLAAYARSLNETYLGGRSRAAVVWGRRNTTRSSRSIRFASYDPARNRITINRKLDRPDIPRYFVEFVLFHEMLHEVLGIGERADGKRDIHGNLFQLMEGTYPDYHKAVRFERELVKRLGTL